MVDITQDELKRLLHYDPDTGIFTWREDSGHVNKGKATGCDDGRGYVMIRIKGKTIRAHRLVWLYMYGHFPKGQVDHINRIKSDNRLCNLRDVPEVENKRNYGLSSKNTSGITGVGFDNKNNVWYGQIGIGRKGKYLAKRGDLLTVVAWRMRMEQELGYHENHGTKT